MASTLFFKKLQNSLLHNQQTEIYSRRHLQPSAPTLTSPLAGWLPQRASYRQPQSSWWMRQPRQRSFHPAFCRQTPPVCKQLLPRRCSSQKPWLYPLSGKKMVRTAGRIQWQASWIIILLSIISFTSNPSEFSPTASTIPEHSNPGTSGGFGGLSIVPWRTIRSRKFSPLQRGKFMKICLWFHIWKKTNNMKPIIYCLRFGGITMCYLYIITQSDSPSTPLWNWPVSTVLSSHMQVCNTSCSCNILRKHYF